MAIFGTSVAILGPEATNLGPNLAFLDNIAILGPILLVYEPHLAILVLDLGILGPQLGHNEQLP